MKEIEPRHLFAIDGLGALLSSFLLGGVLARHQSTFGLPAGTLYVLAALAACLCLYSFACSIFAPLRWRSWMRGLAAANLLYCCGTLGLIVYLHKELSVLGVAYFVGEIAIIIALASIELKRAARPRIPRN